MTSTPGAPSDPTTSDPTTSDTTTSDTPAAATAADGSATAAEAADALGLSAARVRQLARDGRLDVVATGPVRVSWASVTRHREERTGSVPAARSAGTAEGSAEGPAAQEAPARTRWDGRARRWVPAR